MIMSTNAVGTEVFKCKDCGKDCTVGFAIVKDVDGLNKKKASGDLRCGNCLGLFLEKGNNKYQPKVTLLRN